MPRRVSRRHFLGAATAAGAVGFYSGRTSGDEKKPSANDRLHVGAIGIRGQGMFDTKNVSDGGGEIVALCDVDEAVLGEARQLFPKAAAFGDFRKLLDHKGIDAVVIGTPDHWHAPITLRALAAGYHVYCEKPLTHTVAEARRVAEAAAKSKLVTQMGTQIHAGNNYRRVVELVQSGAIGPVGEVHVWCDTVWSGVDNTGRDRPKEQVPVPATLNYDLWLGPAPVKPYHPKAHHYVWRGWWDYGGGALADMACHYTDLPFWALKLRHPTRVHAHEGHKPVDPEVAGRGLVVAYDYPARGELPALKLTWYDGGQRPKLQAEKKLPNWGAGVLFVGEKGMLMANYGDHKLFPEKEFADFTPPKPFIPDSVGHYREWVEACKTGGKTTCNFHYASALTEAVLLGNVSYRSGQPLEWDAKNLRATNAPEVERFLHKEYRRPFTLEG